MDKSKIKYKIGIDLESDFCFYLLDNLYEGVYLLDRNRKILYWNKTAEKITGFTSDEVVGSFCADNILQHIDEYGNILCMGSCPVSMAINDGKNHLAKAFLHNKKGYRVPVFI